MTKSTKIDWINIGLLLISLVISIKLPFKLFLFVYAFLGPLHYLTEINWLQQKNYFIQNKKMSLGLILSCVALSIPFIISQAEGLKFLMENKTIEKLVNFFLYSVTSIVFVTLVFAATLVFTKKWLYILVAVILAIVFSYLWEGLEIFNLTFGVFVPTLIHVYVFTLLFMLYGALKNKSKVGYFSILFTLICPLIIFGMDINVAEYQISTETKTIYGVNGFFSTSASFAYIFNLFPGNHFEILSEAGLKVQMFIAFAYTYHYLNWFSKTTIIGWHKQLTTRKSIIIVLIWSISILLYLYNYRIGFLTLFFLSFLHVFLEFPLNVVSVKGIIGSLRKKKP